MLARSSALSRAFKATAPIARVFSTEIAAEATPSAPVRKPRIPRVTPMNSSKAPAAVGPYSHAVVSSMPSTAYISGQLPLCPETGAMLGGDSAADQAAQCLSNLDKILYRVNATRDTVVKTTVLLTDLADFAAVNKVYAEFFGDHAPARVCYQVTALPKGAKVEIDAIAGSPGPRRPRNRQPKAAAAAEPAAAAQE